MASFETLIEAFNREKTTLSKKIYWTKVTKIFIKPKKISKKKVFGLKLTFFDTCDQNNCG